jgi:outer membrane protein insertion porin family
VTAIKSFSNGRRLCSALLVGTILGGMAAPAFAQDAASPPAAAQEAAPPAPTPVVQPGSGTVQSLAVTGNQRLEPETVISYMSLRLGEHYDRERLDQAIKDLYATELFADVQILGGDTGNLVIQVRENPVINRIVLEGNKRLKDDKINPEIHLAPRQIFTASKARADVARIIELYRRQGRFAATVDPKMVRLDQNRVDVVFEINEGPRSKVRQINILGNDKFSDGELRSQMVTKQSRLFRFFSSSDVYDPDRLAFDQEKLRLYYLTHGYADFRVVSAVAELTPDSRDFIITYVVEEGPRYKFGDVKVESEIRDLKSESLTRLLPMKKGDWYNAKLIEDTVTSLNETAGLFGYAFAQADPNFDRDKDALTMGVTFKVADAPRVYVERVDINGNTSTRDKVIRREFRIAEGDAFNSVRVKRSRDRIQSLDYFQDKLEIEQQEGSTPDRVVLGVNVQEKSTGELQVSAGFSSIERFLVNLSITQRNFMGKGQTVRASVNYSSYSRSAELGFTEPALFNRNLALGGDLYRRDYRNFNLVNNDRNTTYTQTTTGGQIRVGLGLTEYLSMALRYSLNLDDIGLDKSQFFSDQDGDGIATCDPIKAGRYLCDALGSRTTSSVGYSLAYDTTNNSVRPTRGTRIVLLQDFAGLGGSVRYVRTTANAQKYWDIGHSGFIFSTRLEAGYIHSFEASRGPGIDPVRLTDRFFLGEPQIRGFDIRGVGPRVLRIPLDTDGKTPITDRSKFLADDALGGRAYYMGRAELEIPLGSGAKDLGLRPSIFVDAGAVFGVKKPLPTAVFATDSTGKFLPIVNPVRDASGNPLFVVPGTTATNPNAGKTTPCATGFGTSIDACTGTGANTAFTTTINPFIEQFVGDTPKPRVSVGFGVNWNSPFGPFRIDIAKALIKADGDDPKLITFNVGTAF